MSEAFKTFLEDKQTEPDTTAVDWENQKNKWLEHVDNLYNNIEGWLAEYQELANITYHTFQLTEESIGTYDIRSMELSIGSNRILFEPVGTLLIGAWGRINITGPSGIVQSLVLLSKEVKSLKNTIKVKMFHGDQLNDIKGNISIGSETNTENIYPDLEWKYLEKPSGDLTTLGEEKFEQIIQSILG